MRKKKKLVLWMLFSNDEMEGVFTSWQRAKAWGRAELLEGLRWNKIEVDRSHSLGYVIRQALTSKRLINRLMKQVTEKNPVMEAMDK